MSDFNQQQAPRPKTVLNHRDLSMYAPNGEGKFANLNFDVKKNEVLITVRTNLPSDANNDYGRIQAQVPPSKFNAFLEMIRHAALTDKPFRWGYEHWDRKFIGPGKMTDGPVLHYRLVVGREDTGIVFIAVFVDKRPNIKFSFLADTKTRFKDTDGNEMPKDLESKFLALGKVKLIEDWMPVELRAQYKHPEPKQQGQGGGNWQQRNGQGGGGGYGGGAQGGAPAAAGGGGQRAAGGGGASMEDDAIPW